MHVLIMCYDEFVVMYACIYYLLWVYISVLSVSYAHAQYQCIERVIMFIGIKRVAIYILVLSVSLCVYWLCKSYRLYVFVYP